MSNLIIYSIVALLFAWFAETKSLLNYTKIKIMHITNYAFTLIGLIIYFDPVYFVGALVLGWLLYCFGMTITLHKMSSHRSFEPKNVVIKHLLMYSAIMCTLGSTITFAIGHREHHKHADTLADPHYPHGSLWKKIKLFFYFFNTEQVNVRAVKDLSKDNTHKWYHKNYFRILITTIFVLLLISPQLLLYAYAIPVIYVIWGLGWVTVPAHSPTKMKKNYRLFDTNDYSYNSKFYAWVLAGEGFHNTHHAHPGLADYRLIKGEFDPSGWIIRHFVGQEIKTLPEDKIKNIILRSGTNIEKEYSRVTALLKQKQ